MRAAAFLALGVALLLGCGGAAPAQAQPADTQAQERQRIAGERAAAERRFAESQRECLTRFVVTSCVEESRRERRETLSRLHREQNLLDDSLRKERAAERNETIQRRANAEAASDRESKARAAGEPAQRALDDRPRRAAGAASAASEASRKATRDVKASGVGLATKGTQRTKAEEARSRATFDAAQRAAVEHRAEVAERNALRSAKRKPAAPLPLPPAGPAP